MERGSLTSIDASAPGAVCADDKVSETLRAFLIATSVHRVQCYSYVQTTRFSFDQFVYLSSPFIYSFFFFFFKVSFGLFVYVRASACVFFVSSVDLKCYDENTASEFFFYLRTFVSSTHLVFGLGYSMIFFFSKHTRVYRFGFTG